MHQNHHSRPWPAAKRARIQAAIEAVCITVAQDSGLTLEQLLARTRQADTVYCRQLAMSLAAELVPGATNARIARFCLRHPGSVRHARRRIADLCETEADTAAEAQRLRHRAKAIQALLNPQPARA